MQGRFPVLIDIEFLYYFISAPFDFFSIHAYPDNLDKFLVRENPTSLEFQGSAFKFQLSQFLLCLVKIILSKEGKGKMQVLPWDDLKVRILQLL